MRKLFCFMVLAVVVSIMSFGALQAQAQAHSQGVFERFQKEMPKIPQIKDSDFLEQTRLEDIIPYDDRTLGFSVRVPKDWSTPEQTASRNFKLNEKLFVELSSFSSSPTVFGRSHFDVLAIKMDNPYLTVEQWFLGYLLRGGVITEGLVKHDSNRIEALIIHMENDVSYYVRMVVMRNENTIIMAKYYVPDLFMKDQAAIQAQVISSFSLKEDIPPVFPEKKTYRLLDVAQIAFPDGWEVFDKSSRAVDKVDISLLNVGGGAKERGEEFSGSVGDVEDVSKGRVDVSMIFADGTKTLLEEVARHKREFEHGGVSVDEKIEMYGDISYDENMEFALSEAYSGLDSAKGKKEYEYWFTVCTAGNYYFILSLLTPSRDMDFLAWADNIQAYKVIVSNFSPLTGSFLNRGNDL